MSWVSESAGWGPSGSECPRPAETKLLEGNGTPTQPSSYGTVHTPLPEECCCVFHVSRPSLFLWLIKRREMPVEIHVSGPPGPPCFSAPRPPRPGKNHLGCQQGPLGDVCTPSEGLSVTGRWQPLACCLWLQEQE